MPKVKGDEANEMRKQLIDIAAEGSPKGCVVIIHGMSEHIGRYEEFAKRLSERGFYVRGDDLPGHGKYIAKGSLKGYFADRGGWEFAKSKVNEQIQEAKKLHPDLPLIVFAHSMGSMLTRDWLSEHSEEVDAVVLSGTAYMPGLSVRLGHFIAELMVKIRGPRKYSKLMSWLSNREFCKSVKRRRTIFDWLSTDEKQVDKYMQDEYCGFSCTNAFYRDLTEGWLRLGKIKRQNRIRKDLPLYMFSGLEDPVGGMGAGILIVYTFYKSLGMTDVHHKIYPGMRHELINERDNAKVIKEIADTITLLAENAEAATSAA